MLLLFQNILERPQTWHQPNFSKLPIPNLHKLSPPMGSGAKIAKANSVERFQILQEMEVPFGRWHPIRNVYFPQEKEKQKESKPKIVSIPVHFVGSDEGDKKNATVVDPSAAAVKIQKVFRGFLVRKNLKIVRRIAGEVEEIERKVREDEDRIRSDEKERVKVSEMLMSLLFRLDSVRGVRDYRKKVIRRVISLQERVDSLAASRDRDQAAESVEESPEAIENEDLIEEAVVTADGATPSTTTEEKSEEKEEGFAAMEESVERGRGREEMVKEVMGRMVAENEKLKGMVAELCERSAQQCRLMGGLAERVEKLERVVQKMERKKKKRNASSVHSAALENNKCCGRKKQQ